VKHKEIATAKSVFMLMQKSPLLMVLFLKKKF